MIQKTYECEIPDITGAGSGYSRRYKVSAWMAMGSDTVNLRSWDPLYGWSEDYPEHGITGTWTEKISHYLKSGVKTMDDLVEYLFYVKA